MPTNRKEYAQAYYLAHKEQFREYSRRAQEKAKAKDLAEQQARLTYSQRYYAANKELIKERQRKYREKKKKQEYNKTYYQANREKIREYWRAYSARKYKEDKLAKTFMWRVLLKLENYLIKKW